MNLDGLSDNARQRIAFAVEVLSRAVLVAFYALLAINILQDMQIKFRISSFLLLIQELLLLSLILIRRPSVSTSERPLEWGVAFATSFLFVMIRTHGSSEYLIGTIFSCAGVIVTILGVIALNRSFGVVPANRGIRTGGIYRLVRHPLYAGYSIASVGFLINNFSLYNIFILVTWFGFQALRLQMEERHLAQTPDYRSYMLGTRWRLFPGVW